MRHENPSDRAHNKVTCKRRDRCNNVTPRRGGDVPQQRYWAFHLELTGDVAET